MIESKIFVSFDYEKDRNYKYLLEAWNKNEAFEFTFEDKSSNEINSWNISMIKNVLSRKINEANYVLVIIGEDANRLHPDYKQIGYRNWQNFEVAKAKALGKKLLAVQLQANYKYPEELKASEAIRVYSFSLEAINHAINGR